MIIVVEGSDNAGKTTLALTMAKRMKGIYVKSENIPPRDDYLEPYQEILLACQSYGNGIVITDRLHAVSEPIYGPIMRGRSSIDPELAKAYLKRVTAYVYCRPPNATITRNMNERQQMTGVIQSIHQIIEAYDKFFEQDEIRERTWKYDWTKDSEQLLIEGIKRHA